MQQNQQWFQKQQRKTVMAMVVMKDKKIDKYEEYLDANGNILWNKIDLM